MIPPNPIVSEATQDRYDRAEFEYKRALKEWYSAWMAMQRESYAAAEGADANASPETET